MPIRCNPVYTIELPWSRPSVWQLAHRKMSDDIIECYIEFFIHEVCNASWNVVDFTEVHPKKLLVDVTDVQDESLFKTNLPIVNMLKFWALEYAVMCGKELTSPSPIDDILRLWYERALRTKPRKNKQAPTTKNETNENNDEEHSCGAQSTLRETE